MIQGGIATCLIELTPCTVFINGNLGQVSEQEIIIKIISCGNLYVPLNNTSEVNIYTNISPLSRAKPQT